MMPRVNNLVFSSSGSGLMSKTRQESPVLACDNEILVIGENWYTANGVGVRTIRIKNSLIKTKLANINVVDNHSHLHLEFTTCEETLCTSVFADRSLTNKFAIFAAMETPKWPTLEPDWGLPVSVGNAASMHARSSANSVKPRLTSILDKFQVYRRKR